MTKLKGGKGEGEHFPKKGKRFKGKWCVRKPASDELNVFREDITKKDEL